MDNPPARPSPTAVQPPSWRRLWHRLLRLLAPQLAVDLGTSHTPVLVRGEAQPDVEASCLAVVRASGEPVAAGSAARDLEGREPPTVAVVHPVQDGVIVYTNAAAQMLRRLLGKACKFSLRGQRLIVGVPANTTALERQAVRTVARAAGAQEVRLVLQPLAAALGAGLPVMEARGSVVVDIGAGTADVAVISLGNVVVTTNVRMAGDRLDEVIRAYLLHRHHLVVGTTSAERLKWAIGCALPLPTPITAEVRGRSLLTGLPTTLQVSSDEIGCVLQEPLDELVEQLRKALDETSPELSADIYVEGIVLAGGGANLRRIDDFIAQRTGLPVRVARDPGLCVVRGIERFFSEPGLEKSLLPEEAPPGSHTPTSAAARLRSWAVPAALVAASVVLVVGQSWLVPAGGVRPLDEAMRAIVAPLQVAMSAASGNVAADFGRGGSPVPAQTAGQVAALRLENCQLRQLARENERLRGLLAWQSEIPWRSRAARVVGRNPLHWFASVTIGAGVADGIPRGAVVATPAGLVGRVSMAGLHTSAVRLLTDPAMVVPCVAERNGTAGLLYGTGWGACELRYLDPNAPLRVGDVLVTSGLNGSFPRGLPVGRVTSVTHTSDSISAAVEPAVDSAALTATAVLTPGKP